MPLTTDPEILQTSTNLVTALRTAAGPHPSYRPAHAKGHLLTGTFTPTPQASTLSSAPHFNNSITPITLRFSSSTGIPRIPDTDPTSNPRGLAIRFHLPTSADGKRHHTDIITHSTPYFPVRTGGEFLQLLQALGAGGGAVPKFLDAHPETVRFLQDPKPSPESFATEKYFGVNAFKFVNSSGVAKFVRYRIVPAEGVKTYSKEELDGKSGDYLYEELKSRFQNDNGTVTFTLSVQVAAQTDTTDDATVVWPEDEREIVELGIVKVEKWIGNDESDKEQKSIIFDPIPRVEGVEPSGDPLLEVRANVYLISGKGRREA